MRAVCVLRLSALGDVCHTVPLVRAIQDQRPEVAITWIIGRTEARLARLIDGVELVEYDKRSGLGGLLALCRRLAGRRFDALLATQRSVRANVVARMVPTDLRIGYDGARTKELHGLVINRSIAPAAHDQHVMDCLLSFLEPLGLQVPERPRWDFTISAEDEAFAADHIRDDQATMIISAASSHAVRNWSAAGYAAVVDHAASRHGLRIMLCGGPSQIEQTLAADIAQHMHTPVENLVGRDTLGGFLALARRARVVLTPDSGPAHLANAMGTPVLGLYAATDPQRSGPHDSRALCVDRFNDAAMRFHGKRGAELAWGKHIHRRGVMDLITTEEVITALDRLLAARPRLADEQLANQSGETPRKHLYNTQIQRPTP